MPAPAAKHIPSRSSHVYTYVIYLFGCNAYCCLTNIADFAFNVSQAIKSSTQATIY